MNWRFFFFFFRFWNLIEIFENFFEMLRMKYQVICEYEIGFLFLEKEMWVNFNYDVYYCYR